MTCPRCGRACERLTGADLYPGRPALAAKRFLACRPCDLRASCHALTWKPASELADGETRRARQAAHAAFDRLWRGPGGEDRRALYARMADGLGLDRRTCHIAQFDAETCGRVLDWVRLQGLDLEPEPAPSGGHR